MQRSFLKYNRYARELFPRFTYRLQVENFETSLERENHRGGNEKNNGLARLGASMQLTIVHRGGSRSR